MSASNTALPKSLVLVGAGKMGGAMLRGWLNLGLDAKAVTVIEPMPAPDMVAFAQAKGVHFLADATGIAPPDVLVLAIKPQGFDAAAPALQALISAHTVVVSIMAGKSMGSIAKQLPGAGGIVRAMPNTPAAVGRGITGATASMGLAEGARLQADALLRAIGQVEWVATEDDIDAVTAVSGSGPAYVFYLVECLADAGIAAGLAPDVAERLARATIEGSGELLFRDAGTPAATLRKNVTSPGGTTAAALDVLMAHDGLAPLMARAIAAAKKRAGELAG